jgi:hypothetical protein
MCRALWTAPFLLLLLSGCEKDGDTPTYLRVSAPVVIDDNGVDTLGSRITDLWVYVNDKPAGVWEPGKRIPVLASGTSNLKLIAGVRKNGIAASRIQYPFFATYEQTIPATPAGEIQIAPWFQYYDNLTFWTEDFESAGTQFNSSGTADLETIAGADSVFKGLGAGAIHLDGTHTSVHLTPIDPFTYSLGLPAFLEIDYKTDTRFLLGIEYVYNNTLVQIPFIYVEPTGTYGTPPWKHIYIDLSAGWNQSGATERRFYIAAALENGATSGHLWFDNITVVKN